ncbi:MAG: response regulator [Verrucomicrobiae bacterium]|nr:response regulator [Verrucomicrobiae bacterium]
MNGRSRVIAVLDDEPEMLKALSRLLSARGFRVVLFSSGAELLAAPDGAGFDCLIVDLHMPAMSGFDVLGAIAARKTHPPVVVLTGHDDPGHPDGVRALGAAEYLLKPVDQAVLLAAIERVLRPAEPPPPC